MALLADETLARRAREASGQLLRINADALKRDFASITTDSAEAAEAQSVSAHGATAPAGDGATMPPRGAGASR